MASNNSLSSILARLTKADCEFILVGGMSAVLNGAPIQTYDIDIVYSQSEENISRLIGVLEQMHAVFRIQPARKLPPLASHLAASGHLNLITDQGPLDLLSFIGRNSRYDNLLADATDTDIGAGIKIKVLNLSKLIALKEELGGEKDRAMLNILRQTLSEKQKLR